MAWSMVLALLLVVAGVPATHAVAPVDKPQQDEVRWMPELAPRGPLVVVISLPAQQAHVYRNGVRIGLSPVSTGKPGHETPAGIYSILEKRREHHSNLYDRASMPFMQRLTWDGVALHAGRLPGYPASHGCIRLPQGFAEQRYGVTQRGTRVVIAAAGTFASAASSWPGPAAPVDATTGLPIQPRAPSDAEWEWHPERSPDGPVTVLASSADQRVVVLRNAVEIGTARVELPDEFRRGIRAYVVTDGSPPGASRPDRRARGWRALRLAGSAAATGDRPVTMDSNRLSLPPEFARALYDTLQPGDTLVVTDEPLQPPAGFPGPPDVTAPPAGSEAAVTGALPGPAPASCR